MRLIYIAGPMESGSPHHWCIEQNCRIAEEIGLEVDRLGGYGIVPHLLTRNFIDVLPREFWLQADMELISRCDAMVVSPLWRRSEGAVQERAYAIYRKLPVFQAYAWFDKEESDIPIRRWKFDPADGVELEEFLKRAD